MNLPELSVPIPCSGTFVFPNGFRLRSCRKTCKCERRGRCWTGGESAAIELALERKADAILLDELQGRRVAETLGLEVLGILGILLRAKQAGHLELLRPVLDDLQNRSRFWLSAKAREKILGLAGEAESAS